MSDSTERTPRKDVARNRQRLLDAAKAVFAERGLEATLDDIARHAGVGAGTAYRHFGSRNEIVRAIFSDVAGTFIADAEAALDVDDPWTGLRDFIEVFTSRQADDRGLHQVFTGRHGPALDPTDWAALVRSVSALIARAKDAGVIRDDIEFSDLAGLFVTMGPLYDLSQTTGVPIWRRQVDFFLRGIRSKSSPSGTDFPPALSRAQIGDAMTGASRSPDRRGDAE